MDLCTEYLADNRAHATKLTNAEYRQMEWHKCTYGVKYSEAKILYSCKALLYMHVCTHLQLACITVEHLTFN